MLCFNCQDACTNLCQCMWKIVIFPFFSFIAMKTITSVILFRLQGVSRLNVWHVNRKSV